MTFLALDIGNTRLKWAQYRTAHPGAALLAQGAEFLENIDKLADGAWSRLPPPKHILGSVVAGDAVKRRVELQMEMWDVMPQWVVASDNEAGVRNGYDHPTRLGADRWVAIIGAYHRMLAQGAPRPMVVVMVGTAVTVDIARRLEVPELLLLVNKVHSTADRSAVAADVSAAFNAEVAGVLPLSEDMVSNASGGLFSLTNPDHIWSQTLVAVARRLGA